MKQSILGVCIATLLATSGCTSSTGGLTGPGGSLGGTTPGTTPTGGGAIGGTTPTTTGGASCSSPNYSDPSSAWTVPASGYGSYGGQHLPPNWTNFGSEDEIQNAIEGVAVGDRACFKGRWPGAYQIFKRNGGSW